MSNEMSHNKLLLFIKRRLKKYPRIHFYLRSIKRFNDIEFMKKVNSLEIGIPNEMTWHSYGNLNLNINISLIELTAEKTGMGAIIRHVLLALSWADQLGFYPVVSLVENKNPYQEEKGFLGTNNVFEYYFLQPTGIMVKDVYKSNSVFLYKDYNLWLGSKKLGGADEALWASYIVSEKYISNAGELVSKYLRLNQKTENFIKKHKENLFKKYPKNEILGVHIRGTDFNLHWKHHPNVIDPKVYFDIIDKCLYNGFTYIFLATDDSNLLSLFKSRFGDKLLYFSDVHRESGTTNVSLVSTGREHEYYFNGLEVLRDIYVLADCSGFIAGLSQVSICARIIRSSMGKEFRYQKILSNGIYKG